MIDANAGRSFEVLRGGRWVPVIAWNPGGLPMVADARLGRLVPLTECDGLREAPSRFPLGPPAVA